MDRIFAPFTKTKKGPVVEEHLSETFPEIGGDKIVSDVGHGVAEFDTVKITKADCSFDTEIFDVTMESEIH